MRISDWISDVCSSDLRLPLALNLGEGGNGLLELALADLADAKSCKRKLRINACNAERLGVVFFSLGHLAIVEEGIAGRDHSAQPGVGGPGIALESGQIRAVCGKAPGGYTQRIGYEDVILADPALGITVLNHGFDFLGQAAGIGSLDILDIFEFLGHGANPEGKA